MGIHTATVQKLYVAFFNRPGDVLGVTFWEGKMAEGWTEAKIAAEFAKSTEYIDLYKGMNQLQTVATLYTNLFGRTASLTEANFWAQRMLNGLETVDSIALTLANSAQGTDATAIANKVTASTTFTDSLDTITEANGYTGMTANAVARTWLATVTDTAASLTAATASVATTITSAVDAANGALGQTFTLTKDLDEKTGGTGNDTFNGILNGADSTLTALDVINGGAGTDTLNLNAMVAVAALPGVTISGIETINVRGAANVGTAGLNDVLADGAADDAGDVATAAVDFSTISGLTTLNVTQATQAAIKAATTTDVAVSGVTGAIEVNGGKSVTITDATADKHITVGSVVVADADANSAGTAAAGAIVVTDSKQGSGSIQIDGGTSVTVTASTDKTSGAITVGALKAATGAVSVTHNITSDNTAAITAGDVTVTGGTSVTVNVNSTNTASKDSTGVNNITAGTVTVTGDSKTTSVTVNQTHVANDYAAETTGASKEVSTVTFGSLKSGEKVAISAGALTAFGTDLTFTAAKDLTAAEVAAAFASLTAADIQAAGGKVANGIFTGTLDAGWTSGAASGSTVTFTAAAVGNQGSEITVTAKKADGTTDVDNVATFTLVKTDGSAGTTTTARDLTTANGNVVVNDNATAAITSLTINGYGTATIGTTAALSKLADLSLANSGGTATVDMGAAVTALNLTVNKVAHAVDISTNSTAVATLNVTATGANSSFALTAAQVKDLNVSGDKTLTLTGTTTALENVKVTGSASLDISGVSANAAKSVDTTGTTGTVTASIDATAATYAGGAGVDKVTLVTGTALTKSVNLGAGDDTLTLGAAVTGSSATLSGGDGVDTLSMSTSRADALDASAQSFYTNFERLTLNDVNTAALSVDLANLGFTNYVTTSGTSGAVYTGAVTAATAGETFTFLYEGVKYTATLAGTDLTAFNAAIDAAVNAGGVALGANKVTATGAADLTLAADDATKALVGISYDNGGTAINASSSLLTLSNLANGGTVVLTNSGVVSAGVKDAATGTADVLNVIANVAATSKGFGAVIASNVETVNISASDTLADDNGDGTTTTAEAVAEKTTLTLRADSAKTVNVTGDAKVDLTLTSSTKVTLIDGSSMTAALNVTSVNTTDAVTIKGGAGDDTLVSAATSTQADELFGGAGKDSLTANKGMAKLTGGDGADTFNIVVASTNVNSASVIMDLGSGDVISFAGADAFKSAAISLDSTAVFQDFANAAIAAITSDNDLAWFQFGGNTYIVQEKTSGTNENVFVNNEDFIVKITGTVDLSTASFNATSGTLEIA